MGSLSSNMSSDTRTTCRATQTALTTKATRASALETSPSSWRSLSLAERIEPKGRAGPAHRIARLRTRRLAFHSRPPNPTRPRTTADPVDMPCACRTTRRSSRMGCASPTCARVQAGEGPRPAPAPSEGLMTRRLDESLRRRSAGASLMVIDPGEEGGAASLPGRRCQPPARNPRRPANGSEPPTHAASFELLQRVDEHLVLRGDSLRQEASQSEPMVRYAPIARPPTHPPTRPPGARAYQKATRAPPDPRPAPIGRAIGTTCANTRDSGPSTSRFSARRASTWIARKVWRAPRPPTGAPASR